jgi:hypothetical protein
MINLDFETASTAQAMVSACRRGNLASEKIENVVNKALGIVQENGPYAATLFLFTRRQSDDKNVAAVVRANLFGKTAALLSVAEVDTESPDDTLQFLLDHVCADLGRLLFIKQVWEQTLIYARHGAKAMK